MTRNDFINYVNQIQNMYHKKMSETEVDVWYENLKFMSLERFNYILAEIYKTNKFMPTLADILQTHKQIPYFAKKEEKDVKGNCKKCNGIGYIIYIKEIDQKKYKYCAVCDCGRAERYDGTKCTEAKNKSKYYIPTIAETGLEIKENRPTNEEIIESMKKLANSTIMSNDIKNIIRENFRKNLKIRR